MKTLKKRPYVFLILPGLLLYTLFIVAPIVMSIPLAFTGVTETGKRIFVGVENFAIIFGDKTLFPQFLNALKNTFFSLLLNYVIVHPIIIILAYFMHKKILGHSVFQSILFMPNFVNTIALSFMVSLFFSPYLGLYYRFFKFIGLEQWGVSPLWAEEKYGVALIVVIWTWAGLGYEMLLYLANFKMIPVELIEASIIDGASETQRIRKIYFPLLMPTFTNVLVLMFIWTITAFEIPYIVGGVRGGIDYQSDFLALFLYRNVFGTGAYSSNVLGMGSAIGMILLCMLAVGSLIILRLLRNRQVSY